MASNPKRFLVIGAAGYIAPAHFEAIRANGHEVEMIVDPHDSVGVIDRYFPRALYFPDLDWARVRNLSNVVTDVVICTPNDTHAEMARAAVAQGYGVLCEKPLAMNAEQARAIPPEVRCVMQLRYTGIIPALRHKLRVSGDNLLTVDYVTYRGQWYMQSWKNNPARSGGLLLNLGIHILDVIRQVMGPLDKIAYVHRDRLGTSVDALFHCDAGDVKLTLSCNASGRVADQWEAGVRAARTVQLNQGQIWDCQLRGGHELVYRNLDTNPVMRDDAIPALELADQLREAMTYVG